jgi:threonine synthase
LPAADVNHAPHPPINYVSTRGGMHARPFTEILLEGLAPDGGLVVPESYPRLSSEDLQTMREMTYPELALAIIGRFATDIPHDDLKNIIDSTYTHEAFGTTDITPVEPLTENLYLLCTSNGPSLAFKDIAMQLLGNLFPYVLNKTGDELNILGATSGDTGGAAIYAMRGKPGIRVFMLSPYQRTSKFQAAQMFSVLDPNIHNIAIRGVFDDCQDIVKVVGEDAPYKSRQRIGTVNSINWARVVAQVVYYFKGYFAVTEDNDERVAFAVPSGNFGNIFAGHVARMMGLPIERLILATNENDVLDEFFRTGAYRPRASADVHATSSPSMDISKASNFERFVYDLTGRDGERTRGLYDEVRTGGFDLNGTDERRAMSDYKIASGVSTHTDRLATIRGVYETCGRVIDTHTADGVKVAREQQRNLPAGTKILCIETALPIKFGETILEALGFEPDRPEKVAGIEDREQRVQVLDNDAAAVMNLIADVTGL